MAGCFYGIGAGPGDPELLTLKAVRILRECEVIALPQEKKETCTAYKIAAQAVPEIEKKECICLSMPMTKERDVLEKSHEKASGQVIEQLKQGKNVAFITLGDCTLYSTFQYVKQRVKEKGYRTQSISGIPSFCAAAARLNVPLVSEAEELHIIPASYGIEDAVKLSGVKVLMKSGKQIKEVKKVLAGLNQDVCMIENCGMPGERIFYSADEIPDQAGYYSLMIVRENV